MEGYNFIDMRYLGVLHVLLSGEPDGALRKAIEGNKEMLVDFLTLLCRGTTISSVEDMVISFEEEVVNTCCWHQHRRREMEDEFSDVMLEEKLGEELSESRVRLWWPNGRWCGERLPKKVEQDGGMKKREKTIYMKRPYAASNTANGSGSEVLSGSSTRVHGHKEK
ncbi:hypothetical protein ACSQ67_016430 [Phaseolus vulgaris]